MSLSVRERPPSQDGIGGITTRGELERFILDTVQRKGAVRVNQLGGSERLLSLQGRATRGTVTITGTGAASASATVAHGLKDAQGNAVTPTQVIVTTDVGTINASVSARSATTFTIFNQHITDTATYSDPIRNDWIAIA